MSKHHKPEDTGTEETVLNIETLFDPSTPVTTDEGLEALLNAVFGTGPSAPSGEDKWGEPKSGPAHVTKKPTEQIHLQVHEADGIEAFFTDRLNTGEAPMLVLNLVRGGQEIMVMFNEEMWPKIQELLAKTIARRAEETGERFGERA